MANSYYDHTTFPSTGAAGSSSSMRSELDAIEAGFDKLPTIAGNGLKIVGINSGETALVAVATTGTGSVVLAASPTLTTPALGVATATTVNKVALTAPATGATVTIADGKTFTLSNTLTFTGTDASSVAFGAGGTVAYTSNTLAAFAATTSAQLAGIISDETGSGALVFGTSPTLVTPTIGVATATSVNKVSITAPATSATLTVADGKTLTASNTLTLTGTDGSSIAFGTGGTVIYAAALSASTGSSLSGHIASGTGAVATTVQAKLRRLPINSGDYSTLTEARAASATTPVIDDATGDLYLRNDLKVGDPGMYGFADNAYVQFYANLGLPTTIQYANRLVAQSKGDNTTFIGGGCMYVEARDRSDVTASNKGVLYPLTISVVPSVARNNVPYDDANGINITNTTGVVGAKATDGIYFAANATAFGDKSTGTSAWYSGITIDANTDYGIQFGARVLNYAIDMNLANIVSGKAIRLPNASSIVARDAGGTTDRTLIGLDASDVVNIGASAARVDLKVAAIAAAGLQVTGSLTNDGANIPRILGQSGAASSVTGTLVETTLATVTIPANAMKANGLLRVTTYFSCTNSANAKIARVRLGGNIFSALSVTTSSAIQTLTLIRNKNATNSQESYGESSAGGLGITTTAPRTAAVDTTAASSITITATLADAGETITLLGYTVEVLPQA